MVPPDADPIDDVPGGTDEEGQHSHTGIGLALTTIGNQDEADDDQ